MNLVRGILVRQVEKIFLLLGFLDLSHCILHIKLLNLGYMAYYINKNNLSLHHKTKFTILRRYQKKVLEK